MVGEAIILGLLQGFTEFLVGSGHLVIFQRFCISQPGLPLIFPFGTMVRF